MIDSINLSSYIKSKFFSIYLCVLLVVGYSSTACGGDSLTSWQHTLRMHLGRCC